MYKLWSKKDEKKLVKSLNKHLTIIQIAKKVKRSYESVKQKINHLGYGYWNKNWRKSLKYNTVSYIKKFKKRHGNRYDYSKFNYKGADKKSIIICRKHGKFIQTSINHSLGNGCPKCKLNKLTTKLFIDRSKIIHKNKYDYSKTIYSGRGNFVIIRCPVHGFFKQKPEIHLKGSGCDQCRRDKRRTTTDEFIRKSKKIHKNKYDYSKTKYISNKQKVTIICKTHGRFYQSPQKHLNGRGCDACGGSLNKTQRDFLKKCVEVHGGKYDYSKSVYKNSHKKLKIICRKHGSFNQTPASHWSGRGCPSCSSSYGESLIEKWLIKHNINFVHQKTFKNCYDKRQLPFDFFLPDYNTCVEYNGRQHYQRINFFGTQSYNDYKKHDKIKKKFCKNHDLKLIVIKYSDNIFKKLEQIKNG